MKIAVGTDHAGFHFKEALKAHLRSQGHQLDDLGAHSEAPCDYPDYAREIGKAVALGQAERGILVCGSGIGMSIAANKVKGVRAALCHDLSTARLARFHNDANVLVLPARLIALPLAKEITELFLVTPFEGGRHEQRLRKIKEMES